MNRNMLLILGGAVLLYWLWKKNQDAAAAATPAAPKTAAPGTTTAIAPPTTTTMTTTSTNPAASAYEKLKTAIAGDTFFSGSGDALQGTPYHFNFYLAQLTGKEAPDLAAVFPGVDLNSPMTVKTYWSGILAYLGGTAPADHPVAAIAPPTTLAGLGRLDFRQLQQGWAA